MASRSATKISGSSSCAWSFGRSAAGISQAHGVSVGGKLRRSVVGVVGDVRQVPDEGASGDAVARRRNRVNTKVTCNTGA